MLLADVIPSFLMKLCAPYFIHAVPYSIRIILFAILSTSGMLLIALTPAYIDGGTITTKMAGVVLASLSSGGGELSFLGLTHFYGPFSLAAWGSGTGAAGLLGAGAYALATTALRMSVKSALLASSFLPVIMLLSFFIILPLGAIRQPIHPITTKDRSQEDRLQALPRTEPEDGDPPAGEYEDEGLLSSQRTRNFQSRKHNGRYTIFRANLHRAGSLFFPLYASSSPN